MRVPLIITGPGIPRGKTSNALVYLFDLFPTLAELFGLMREWQITTNDTLPLTAHALLPLRYDHTLLVRKPDVHQPQYTLDKYFSKERKTP